MSTDNTRQDTAGAPACGSVLSCRTIHRDGGEPHHYFVAGNGLQTMVIVNAFGQSVAFWELAAGLLADRYRIVVVQPRGTRPATGAMQSAYSIREHVRDLEAVFNAEAIGAAHVVGWHTAFKTVLGFYAANRQRVMSMAFLSASAFDRVGSEPLHSRYEAALSRLCRIVARQPSLAGHVVELLKDLLSVQPASSKDGVPADMDGDEPDRIVLIKSLALEPFRTPDSVVNYSQQLLEYWAIDAAHILPDIAVPALFIGGDADHITSMKAVKETAAHVPKSAWIKVRGGTHYMQCDRYRLLGSLLAEFADSGWSFDYRHAGLRCGRGDRQTVQSTVNSLLKGSADARAMFLTPDSRGSA